jgi:hypothetical protein
MVRKAPTRAMATKEDRPGNARVKPTPKRGPRPEKRRPSHLRVVGVGRHAPQPVGHQLVKAQQRGGVGAHQPAAREQGHCGGRLFRVPHRRGASGARRRAAGHPPGEARRVGPPKAHSRPSPASAAFKPPTPYTNAPPPPPPRTFGRERLERLERRRVGAERAAQREVNGVVLVKPFLGERRFGGLI